MKTVFRIAKFDANGTLNLLKKEYGTYPDAEKGILDLPADTYQVQKVFIKL